MKKLLNTIQKTSNLDNAKYLAPVPTVSKTAAN